MFVNRRLKLFIPGFQLKEKIMQGQNTGGKPIKKCKNMPSGT
jgi:hypothetical protein